MSTENGAVVLGYEDLKGMAEELLLKVSMASIEDAKAFTLFPAGAFMFTVTKSALGNITRGKDTFRGAEVVLSLTAVQELGTNASNEGLGTPEPGTEFTVQVPLNEAIQFFKTTWGPVAQELGVYAGTLNEWLAKFNGINVMGVITHQKDKNNELDAKGKVKHYARIASLKLV